MTRATFFKHFDLLADQPDAVAKMREFPAQLRRSDMFIEHASHKTPKLRRSGMDTLHDVRRLEHLMKTRCHAAPPGLDVCWGTIGYKQAAPTELATAHRP